MSRRGLVVRRLTSHSLTRISCGKESKMQIETLKIFCDLVETHSFSQAAERNFVTQSAVSQQVRGLEEKFRKRLLERVRGRREVRLTEAGKGFYEESRKVIAAYDDLQERMRGLDGTVSGTVHVATVYS